MSREGRAIGAAVEVRGLFRVYSTPEGAAAAVQGLDLSVAQGEVLVVLGPSGSGKTTLLRLLAGLDRPSAGTLRVLGLDLPKLSARRLAAYRSRVLGYVDQHYTRALAPELRVRELVGLRLALLGAPRAERERAAEHLLHRVGLADRRDAYPDELSGGEQQRVAVCAALAHGPRLLLADEPTGELDSASAEAVYRMIGELVREHACTTIIVSHDPESAAIADRVVWIRDGRVSEERARMGDDAIVVGRGGWLRIPEEFLLRAGIRTHATIRLHEDGVLVSPLAAGSGGARTSPGAKLASEPATRRSAVVAELRSVEKVFGSGARARKVFAGLSAAFPAGRLVAVSGRSGSGKTTLLGLLAGLEQPTAGSVVVAGEAISALDRTGRAHLRREHVAFVRQEPGLVPFLSVEENLELALGLRGVARAEASERALEALAAVGLMERAGHRSSRLSAGERQRAAVARAIAVRPSLLLADEPTARLDQATALEVAGLLARVARERGVAVVCATHDPLVIGQADEELPLAGRT